MIDKIYFSFIIFILNILICSNVNGAEIFNFNVTEIEILEEGNKFIGKKGGTVTTEEGIIIKAKSFEYDKYKNILIAIGDVKIVDNKENIIINSEKITYFKNKEIILTQGKSEAINEGITINANNFEYNKINNTINANGEVNIKDNINDYVILAHDATYYKNLEKIVTEGDTQAFIQSKYIINSKDVTYFVIDKILSSEYKTKIKDQNSRVYFTEKFKYLINQEVIKGEKFLIITNYNLPKSDKIYLENAIINLKNNEFIAKDTKIKIHKDIFDNTENDPRIKGVSSKGDENYTVLNKGVFTSCKKNDNCPPWAIQSKTIKHDKIKKTLNYDNAVIRIYDFPVFYFPKFYHPDPSVKRQSGLLKPEINNSNILGSSVTLPYFKVISENKDLTLTPTMFDSDTMMASVEYRQENKNSQLLADFGYVNDYQSPTTNKKNSLSHLFLDFYSELNFKDYISSDLTVSIEKVSNDSYLNVFDQYITKSSLKPSNSNRLRNDIKISLDHEDYDFQSGVISYENLKEKKQSDKHQYVLPYYNFDKNISQNYFDGNVSFNSNGNNVLDNTNKLETNIINNLTYNSLDFFTELGLKNNFGINLKNLNSVGKKSSKYKNSVQSEIISLYNIDATLPLSKESEKSKNFLTPKLSFRINPSDMKDYSSSNRIISANNVFAINRFGLSDSFESGKSLTLGVDYKKEKKGMADNLRDINSYFEAKLATVLRDNEESFIPNRSSLNRTTSNLFGSITNHYSDNFKIGYDFSLDNDFNTLEHNQIDTTFSINNVVTNFNFIESNGERGDTNIFASSVAYSLDDENSFSFSTRRNRKINLTEFYDLVYQYKNDCLTAGIKYKKDYYSDGAIKPTENILFTVTLFPLTTFEYDAEQDLKRYRDN
jgi:LPS-assembly protein